MSVFWGYGRAFFSIALAAKMFGVPVKMIEMRRSTPIATTAQTPKAIHEYIAWARARRNGRIYRRRNHYGSRDSDANAKRNARRREHRAARQKQTR